MSAIAEQVVRLTLPDGSVREVAAGTTGEAVAASIGARLAKDALAVKLDGQILDLKRPITASGAFEVITPKHPDALEVYRHSTAHLTAHAVKRLFPGVKIGIGPAIEHGFYYDFDPGRPFTHEDLEKIEAEMRKIVAENAADRARRDVEGRGRGALRGAGRPPEGGDRLRHPRGLALVLPAGRLRRPLPRAARPVDGEARRLQADARRRRLLEGRRAQPDAPADLRRLVPLPEGAGRAPPPDGAGPRARPPQARQGAGALPLPPVGAGLAVLPAEGGDDLQPPRRRTCGSSTRSTATRRS